MRVTKAVIPAGGYATRFLPITKGVPKEMMPIGSKPTVHFIVEELREAGITDVLILIGRGRECLVNYFDKNYELDDVLGHTKMNFFPDMNIIFKRVPLPKGAADNISFAKNFAGDDPFIVAYSDNIFFEGNPTRELVEDFQTHGKNVACVVEVVKEDAHKYGIVKPGREEDSGIDVAEIVEKPQNPPSCLAGMGRYLLLPQIFDFIEADRAELSKEQEICMTRQLNKFARINALRAVKTNSRSFDTGTPASWHEANRYFFTLHP